MDSFLRSEPPIGCHRESCDIVRNQRQLHKPIYRWLIPRDIPLPILLGRWIFRPIPNPTGLIIPTWESVRTFASATRSDDVPRCCYGMYLRSYPCLALLVFSILSHYGRLRSDYSRSGSSRHKQWTWKNAIASFKLRDRNAFRQRGFGQITGRRLIRRYSFSVIYGDSCLGLPDLLLRT